MGDTGFHDDGWKLVVVEMDDRSRRKESICVMVRCDVMIRYNRCHVMMERVCKSLIFLSHLKVDLRHIHPLAVDTFLTYNRIRKQSFITRS